MEHKFEPAFFLDSTGKTPSSHTRKLNSGTHIFQKELAEYTSGFPVGTSWLERVNAFIKGISVPPSCPVCSGPLKFTGTYQQTCSKKCGNIIGKQNRENTMMERYGALNPSSVKSIRDRANETHRNTIEQNNAAIQEKRFNTLNEKTPNWKENLANAVTLAFANRTEEQRIATKAKTLNTLNKNDPDWKNTKSKKSKDWWNSLSAVQIKTAVNKRVDSYIEQKKDNNPLHKHLYDRDYMELAYSKYTMEEIGVQLGVTHRTVGLHLKELGIKTYVGRTSKAQTRLFEYIRDELGQADAILNYKYNGNFEFDIFVPSKNVAIEYNGVYWHSSESEDEQTRHQDKFFDAEKLGIRLLTISDDSWDSKTSIWKSIIKNALGITERKIFARHCKVVDVSSKEEREFLDNNHLQGYCRSKQCVGLEFEDKLVMVLSVGASRFSNEGCLEIIRIASILNTNIVGGISKCLAVLRNEKLISYCSLDYGTGKAYLANGFTEVKVTTPGYFWVKGSSVLPRYKTQKSKLAALLENFDSNKTEIENMIVHGYSRYFNCGNRLFVKN